MMIIERKELYQAIDRLPESAVSELARYVEYLEFRMSRNQKMSGSEQETYYKPVQIPGKIIAEVDFSPEYIAEARKELWAGFGEAQP
ncbi:MAG: hypothetical protein GWP17_06425 [Aquificales bacterium]|nr:hypothetical protein [Aquificales bacterium]